MTSVEGSAACHRNKSFTAMSGKKPSKPDNSQEILSSMPQTLREQILNAPKRRYATSEIVINSKTVKVGQRSLTEEELSKYEAVRGQAKTAAEGKAAFANQRRRLVVLTTVDLDEQGNPTDTLTFGTTDIIELESIDAAVTARLYSDANDLVYGTRTPVEDAVKNSDATDEPSSPVK